MSDPTVVVVPNAAAPYAMSGAPQQPQQWAGAAGPMSVTVVMQPNNNAAPDALGVSARYSFNIAVWGAVLNGVALVLSLVCLFVPWVVVNLRLPVGSSEAVGLFGRVSCSSGGQCQTLTWAAAATAVGSINVSAAIAAVFGVPIALIAIAALMFLLALIGNAMHAVTAKKLIGDSSINTKMCCLGSSFSGTGLSATGFLLAWIGSALGIFWFSITAASVSVATSTNVASVTTPGINAAGCVLSVLPTAIVPTR
jgi:hypothetical protein